MHALEEAKTAVFAIIEAAVRGLAHSSNKVVYADWLSRLGPMILPEIEKLYLASSQGETKTSTAIMMLYFGNKLGLKDVIAALDIGNPYQFLAASKLANAGVVEAAVPILELVKTYVMTQPLDDEELSSKLYTLFAALKKLSIEIPDGIKERLTAPGVSKYVSALVIKPIR